MTRGDVEALTAGAVPLVAANAVAVATALFFGWPIGTLVWPYLAQSVAIGWLARRRMLDEPRISTEGLTSNGRPVPPTPEGRRSTANFFAVHYGFFHVMYAIAIVSTAGWPSAGEMLGVASLATAFAWTHARSFRDERAASSDRPVNLGALMFVPYLRIVPMHLTILFGGLVLGATHGWPVLLFGVLKTASDVAMHFAEQALLRRGAGADASRERVPV